MQYLKIVELSGLLSMRNPLWKILEWRLAEGLEPDSTQNKAHLTKCIPELAVMKLID
jgi:hypothetical protein